jgi:type II secretory pathway pseudopilin PulG
MTCHCANRANRMRLRDRHYRPCIKSGAAFTLIETLIYLAIFAIIIGGLVSTAYALFESSGRTQTKAMVQDEANFVMAKILSSMNNAKTVCVPVAGALGPTLMLVTYSGTSCGSPDVTISTSSSDVFLNGNQLNNSNVSFGRLRFVHTASGGVTKVEIDIDLSAKTPNGQTISHSASTTRSIRN